MAKDAWDRLVNTMEYIETILGVEPTDYIIRELLPLSDTPAWNQLSGRISLGGGWRGIKKDAKTQRRRAKRAYTLLLIVLKGQNEQQVQEEVQRVETLYKVRERKGRYDYLIGSAWRTYDQTVDCTTLRPRLTEFRNNVYNFMRRYSVLPTSGLVKDGSDVNYDLVTIDGTGNDPLVHRMVLTPDGSRECLFKLTYAPTTKQAQGVPIYFLPWQSARIVKMTLGTASNIFFTAAINGCSVFVEGAANSPTVYHAGINPPWPAMANTVSQHVRTAKGNDNIPLVWRELFWDKSVITPRNNQNFGEINKAHYVNDGTVVGNNVTTARADTYHNSITIPWRNRNFDIVSCSPWGCVFGIRDPRSGNWAFYLQENVTITYIAPDNTGYRTTRVLRLTRFFPGRPQHFPPTINANRIPNQNDPMVMRI